MSIKARWMLRRALRKETKQKYLQDANHCPFCHSDDISADHFEDEVAGQTWRDVVCQSCDKRWAEIWKLIDVESDESEESTEQTREWEERWHKR